MHTVGSYEAKTRLPELLRAVELGEVVTITRRGVPIVNERRGRVTAADTTAFLRDLGRLPIRVDVNPGERLVLALARKHRLSVHDAAYLELAVRLAAPVASMDRALNAAARSEGAGIV